jgi:3-methyladenine DNA glycosylase/8-oxoguanine DNA glycosylase
MRLKKVESVEISPTAPFNFDATFYKPDHFTSGDNFWEPGVRWQTWLWQDKSLGLKFVNSGSVQKPRIKVEIFYNNKLPQQFVCSLIEEIKYRYNLDLNLTDFYKQFEKDKDLGPIIKRLYGMRPGHPNSLYEYLIIGIVLQNATVKRSIQMFKALLEKYGTQLEYDKKHFGVFGVRVV